MSKMLNNISRGVVISACGMVFFLLLVLVIVLRGRFDSFLIGIREARLGMSEYELDRLFPLSDYERVIRPMRNGGKCIIIFRYGIDPEHDKSLLKLPEIVDSATAIPYFYGEFVLSMDKNGIVDGFCYDGEGRAEGDEFWMRHQ